MTAELVIEAQGLSALSGVRYLLQDINWQVRRGEQWVVFGPNGCGKTTLLSIIAGYKSPSRGQLKVLDQSFTADNVLALRRQIGWISASFFDKCYSRESILSIVLSGKFGTLGVEGDLTNADMARAIRLLTVVGLRDKLKATFQVLSKGERQNVLIARAFMSAPEILILDEPGTGLDVLARESLLCTIAEMAQEQAVTTIYVTHYPEEILPCFDHCLLLRHGMVYAQGPTDGLLTSAEMSRFLERQVTVSRQNGRFQFAIDSRAFDFAAAQEV